MRAFQVHLASFDIYSGLGCDVQPLDICLHNTLSRFLSFLQTASRILVQTNDSNKTRSLLTTPQKSNREEEKRNKNKNKNKNELNSKTMHNKPGQAWLALVLATTAVIVYAPARVQAIPPPIFGFPDSDNHTELGVTYSFNGNTTTVQEAMLFGGNVTQAQPQLSVNPALYQSVAAYTGPYLVLMVDPDASTPEDPSRRFILHWLAPNVTQQTTTTTTTSGNNSNSSNGGAVRTLVPPSTDFVSYRPPTPPETSSAHRYILYAFAQPANFAMPAAYSSLAGGNNRTNFNLTTFISAAGLGRPAAAEYFYVSRQTQVPGTFVARAGATYPGGNGGAIFENSPNAAGTTNSSTTNATTGGSTTTTTTTSGATSVWEGLLKSGFWGLLALL